MGIILNKKLKNLKLDSDVDGQKQFWDMVMEALDSEMFGAFIIGKKNGDALGYYTNVKKYSRIVVPEESVTYNETDNTVKFKDDKCFGIFIHEASHFLHIQKQKGLYISKELKDMHPFDYKEESNWDLFRKENEYEAGWRSVFYNKLYKMLPDELVISLNAENMTHYLSKPAELIELVNEKIKFLYKNKDKSSVEKINKTLDKIQDLIEERLLDYIKNIKKFSELSNFAYPYPLTKDDEDQINNMVDECLK